MVFRNTVFAVEDIGLLQRCYNYVVAIPVRKELLLNALSKPVIPFEIGMMAFIGAATKAKPKRKVYDCQNTWEQRVKLVRGEGKPASGNKDADSVYNYGGVD